MRMGARSAIRAPCQPVPRAPRSRARRPRRRPRRAPARPWPRAPARARRSRSRSRARRTASSSGTSRGVGAHDPDGAEGQEDLADRRRLVGDAAPDPVRRPDEVAAVHLAQVLDAERRRHGQVDRLGARVGQAPQRVGAELGQVAVADAAAGQAHHHRPGPERAAEAVPLDERVPLQRGHEPRHRALGQVGRLGQLAHADRRVAVRNRDEQLGGAVDRLCPGRVRH